MVAEAENQKNQQAADTEVGTAIADQSQVGSSRFSE
jgi:hypothetical protein